VKENSLFVVCIVSIFGLLLAFGYVAYMKKSYERLQTAIRLEEEARNNTCQPLLTNEQQQQQQQDNSHRVGGASFENPYFIQPQDPSIAPQQQAVPRNELPKPFNQVSFQFSRGGIAHKVAHNLPMEDIELTTFKTY
jgi:hypothetical protein